ncbi:NAD(P)H-hydrate epimerase [Parenemella sanctibonifatiensis]|uniref:Bifunctional NAD(P)H-hydrate repair enzyme n=1 Tax=Parenemella sanctibonifatiensis TaxID=2016505 RepID=A0A255E7S6_9ACTN|nr:NAD(P)H-hydrate epimerase [Parenemella sanctibonifatiensis]OYN87609.1 NAD(P)H-hydrate epimerase [Parenemella sanctibonifatiensis]
MRDIASVAEIRAAEEAAMAAEPGGPDRGTADLMLRAAEALAQLVWQELDGRPEARVLLLVGPGNNGGDGLWAAQRLLQRGVRVSCWRTAPDVHVEGWAAATKAGLTEIDAAEAIAVLPSVDLAIDAVFGIGARPGLPDPVATWAAAASDIGTPVVAVDLPSGLAADQVGADASHVRAAITVTFGAAKLCHLAQPAASACGRLEVVDLDLGLPPAQVRAVEPHDVATRWPVPGPLDDKYRRGVAGIDAGSGRYPGAGILATTGALYAGAGMVRFLGPEQAAQAISLRMPSVTIGPGRVQAMLLGSGWGDRADARKRIAAALELDIPLVLDADALRSLPDSGLANCLLTPHAGELAAMLDIGRTDVTGDPIAAVRRAAIRTGATVLLKGATQYVAGPGGDGDDGRVDLAVPGPAWTGQAGSGDTLAGMAATLLASGLTPRWAALVAASMQAMTAARNPGPWPPDEIAARVPDTVAWLVDQAPATARLSNQTQ